MTTASTSTNTTEVAPRPRSRLRAHIALACLSACGLAALAWASFLPDHMRPVPRLIYNPSDSVAVGGEWVEPKATRTRVAGSADVTSRGRLAA